MYCSQTDQYVMSEPLFLLCKKYFQFKNTFYLNIVKWILGYWGLFRGSQRKILRKFVVLFILIGLPPDVASHKLEVAYSISCKPENAFACSQVTHVFALRRIKICIYVRTMYVYINKPWVYLLFSYTPPPRSAPVTKFNVASTNKPPILCSSREARFRKKLAPEAAYAVS